MRQDNEGQSGTPGKRINTATIPMSYTILYRSMFVRLKDGKYIPMVEMGDNNVYEKSGPNARRSRSWHQWVIGKNRTFAHRKEEIMKEVEQWIEGVKERYVGTPKDRYGGNAGEYYTLKDIEREFGWFDAISIAGKTTDKTTAQMIRNFFLRGFCQAVDMEESVTLEVHWSTEYPHYERRLARTEEELLEAWEEGKACGKTVWISYHHCADYLWDTHRHKAAGRKPLVPRMPEEVAFNNVMGYDEYQKVAKVGERILVEARDLTKPGYCRRAHTYTVVSTGHECGIMLRKFGGRKTVYIPRSSRYYGILRCAVLTDEDYRRLAV